MDHQTLSDYGEKIVNRIKELIQKKEIYLLYLERDEENVPSEYIKEIATIKRFLECWCADEKFREAVESNPTVACQAWGFDLDPVTMELRPLWDNEMGIVENPSIHVLRYKAFIYEKLTHRNKIRENSNDSYEAYNEWRSRQMRRCENQLSYFISKSIVHAPFCIELSQGCSVGCWFCGISAPKLEDLFLYTEENKQLFKGVTLVLKELFGEAAGKGFCYWATDPFDNPDYEKFMLDFEQIVGVFPQNTTALALRDIDRTRAYLKLSRQFPGFVDRFSLLSLKQVHKVFDHFTPEELLYVELVTQNKENILHKSRAGRAIEKEQKRKKPAQGGDQLSDGTIACVSGFLINMVSREIKLITPCMASEKWPLGYIELEKGQFNTLEEFKALAFGMVHRHMKKMPLEKEPLQFYHYLDVNIDQQSIHFQGLEINRSFPKTAALARIVECLMERTYSTEELYDQLWEEGIQIYETSFAIYQLLNNGLLDLEPSLEQLVNETVEMV